MDHAALRPVQLFLRQGGTGGNFHLSAALDRVSVLTCLAAEMPRSGRRCCSSQVMRSSSASTLARRSARPRSCGFHAFWVPFQHRGGGTPPTPCPKSPQEDAVAMATEGVEGCARVRKKACLDAPRDRGSHVSCRVRVSASASTGLRYLYFGAASASVSASVSAAASAPTSLATKNDDVKVELRII